MKIKIGNLNVRSMFFGNTPCQIALKGAAVTPTAVPDATFGVAGAHIFIPQRSGYYQIEVKGGDGSAYYYNDNPPLDGGNSCFIAGTMVLMGDLSTKPIEDIVSGDKVIGVDGLINNVIEPYSVKLGNKRNIIKFADNSLIWSAEHLLWVKDDNGNEYWGTHDYHQYNREKGIYNLNGIEIDYKGLTKKEPIIIHKPMYYANLNGWIYDEPIIDRTYGDDTYIYSMAVDGSHSYIVNGYVASGFVDDTDYDYSRCRWGGING